MFIFKFGLFDFSVGMRIKIQNHMLSMPDHSILMQMHKISNPIYLEFSYFADHTDTAAY